MTPDQRLLMIGGYISSALYLSGCFIAGLVRGPSMAWKDVLFALGFSCFAYALQLAGHRRCAIVSTVCSWLAGAVAGGWLLLGG